MVLPLVQIAKRIVILCCMFLHFIGTHRGATPSSSRLLAEYIFEGAILATKDRTQVLVSRITEQFRSSAHIWFARSSGVGFRPAAVAFWNCGNAFAAPVGHT